MNHAKYFINYGSYKTSETLLGIETVSCPVVVGCAAGGYKTSETLLGIETRSIIGKATAKAQATKPLKPF